MVVKCKTMRECSSVLIENTIIWDELLIFGINCDFKINDLTALWKITFLFGKTSSGQSDTEGDMTNNLVVTD